MIRATVRCAYNSDIEQLFALEDKVMQNERSKYTVTKKGEELLIEVESKDFVSFRAVMNAITKILSIYSKAEAVVNE